MNEEYISNPRLALLAEELQILNESLIGQGLPDSVRLFRMRDFAEASREITDSSDTSHLFDLDHLPPGVEFNSGTFTVRPFLNGAKRKVGSFKTYPEAIAALEAAMLPEQQARAERRMEKLALQRAESAEKRLEQKVQHLHDDPLPIGVQRNAAGRFKARITKHGKAHCIGTFDTPQQAHEAFRQAHVEYHGIKSAYYEKAAA